MHENVHILTHLIMGAMEGLVFVLHVFGLAQLDKYILQVCPPPNHRGA